MAGNQKVSGPGAGPKAAAQKAASGSGRRAPVSIAQTPKGWDPAPEYTSYDQVPAFRKRYVLVLLFLFLTPVMGIIALSRDCYAEVEGPGREV